MGDKEIGSDDTKIVKKQKVSVGKPMAWCIQALG